MDGVEQRPVVERCGAEVSECLRGPEVGAEPGEAECGLSRSGEGVEGDSEALPDVAVVGAAAGASEFDDSLERVPAAVAVDRDGVSGGVMQQAACLGDEQEDEAVDEAEQLAVVVVDGEFAGFEAAAQLAVGGVGEEPGAERFDSGFDAAAELVECAGAVGAGLVGPAFEGQLDSGIPFGSASGNLYRSTPKLAQWKYVLPVDVFEIQDYQAKYYTILRLALQERNVTYLGTANPSTLLRLLEVAVESRDQLLRDLEQGTLACAEKIPVEQRGAILRACQQSDPRRADELRTVLQEGNSPTCQDLWPFLKLVATWTGGSCGIALKSLKSKLPPDATLIDLGILASELCVSVTLSPASNAGLPTFWENFFEFVDVRDYEQHGGPFLTLDQLEVGQDYYLFVTTSAGLFRYAMHDIVRVQGRFEQTPLIEFLQKGAGVTSITGEKLYESQVLQAMREVEQVCGFRTRFYQFVADEVAAEYILYLETDVGFRNPMLLAEELDCRLAALNYEYRAKRDSRRLHPPRVCFLKHGTLDCYKQQMFKRGRSESQFKTLSLCYRRELEFDYEPFLILLNSDEQA